MLSYDPSSGVWEKKTSMKFIGKTAVTNDKGHIASLGGDYAQHNIIWTGVSYDGSSDSFYQLQPFHYYQFGEQITPMLTGKYFLAGGSIRAQGVTPINRTFIYDPDTERFRGAAFMLQKRVWHGLHTLPDGKIIAISGMYDAKNNKKQTTEIYDPETNTWTYGPIPTIHNWQVFTTQLGNGDIMVFSLDNNYNIKSEMLKLNTKTVYKKNINNYANPEDGLVFRVNSNKYYNKGNLKFAPDKAKVIVHNNNVYVPLSVAKEVLVKDFPTVNINNMKYVNIKDIEKAENLILTYGQGLYYLNNKQTYVDRFDTEELLKKLDYDFLDGIGSLGKKISNKKYLFAKDGFTYYECELLDDMGVVDERIIVRENKELRIFERVLDGFTFFTKFEDDYIYFKYLGMYCRYKIGDIRFETMEVLDDLTPPTATGPDNNKDEITDNSKDYYYEKMPINGYYSLPIRIKYDGSKKNIISNKPLSVNNKYFVWDDYITYFYYPNNVEPWQESDYLTSNGTTLVIAKTDGTKEYEIHNVRDYDVDAKNKRIIFESTLPKDQLDIMDGKLYISNYDGSNKKLLLPYPNLMFRVNSDSLFYGDYKEHFIKAINLDGTNHRTIISSDKYCYSFRDLDNNYVYYTKTDLKSNVLGYFKLDIKTKKEYKVH